MYDMPMPIDYYQNGWLRYLGSGFSANNIGSTMSSLGSIVNPMIGMAMNLLNNYFNGIYAENHMDWYMNNYGSPEAQLRNMRKAGISPFAAAQGISGSAGSPNVTSTPQNFDLGSFMRNMDNALTNPLRSENLKSDTGQKVAATENQYNRIKYDNAMLEALVESLNLDNSVKSIFRDRYDELLNLDVEKAKAEVKNFEELWKKYTQEIKESESRIPVNESDVALNRANTGKINVEARTQAFELACKELGIDINTPVGQAIYKEYVLQEKDFTVDDIYDAHERLFRAAEEGKNKSDVQYNYGMYYQGKLINNEKRLTSTLNDISGRLNKIYKNLSFNGVEAHVYYNDKGDVTVTYRGKSDSYAVKQWKAEIQKLTSDYNRWNRVLRENRQRGSIKAGTLKVPLMQ